jgi:hypothetical protein
MYLSPGNIKVKCPTFSLISGATCKPGVACKHYCYAKKAERQYPNVRNCRRRNYRDSRRRDFVQKMYMLLSKKRTGIIRIHEAGDYYSKEYIEKWYQIASAFPDKKFYSYTKRDDLFNKRILSKKPSNMILIYSLDGIRRENPIKEAKPYMNRGFDKVSVVVHDYQEMREENMCQAITDKSIKCQRHCHKCSTPLTDTSDYESRMIYLMKH